MSFLFKLLCILPILQLCTAELNTEWENFKLKYNKIYQNPEEEAFRKTVFANSLKYIQEHNIKHKSGFASHEIETNGFADLTDDEFKTKYLNPKRENDNDWMNITESPIKDRINPPPSRNWVNYGFRNPILNQGGCGSCYTFGAIAAIEAQYFIKWGYLVQFSHQEVLDCSTPLGNNGCDGGLTQWTFEYAVKSGIGFALNHPYLGREDTCRITNPRHKISGFYKIDSGNEAALLEVVGNIGPVAFGFDADKPSFRFYKDGIYYEPQCSSSIEDLSHAMVIVGYGTENNQDYWLVRNSWGAEWGENGHMKVPRNMNHCGIASRALYPA